MIWRILQKILDVLASLELAVVVILALATVLAVGTIYESNYGAAIASQLIYRGIWMQGLLWLLLLNVTAVAASRLPWKKHHTSFLITHLGIVILLLGSFLTQQRGVDGVLAIAPQDSARLVRMDENMLYVFRAVPGKSYDLLLTQQLQLSPLRPLKHPKEWALKDTGKSIRVTQYYPKATRDVSASPASSGGVPALYFKLQSSRANLEDWLFFQDKVGATRDLGPARIRLERNSLRKFLSQTNSKQLEKPTLFILLQKEQKMPLLVAGHPKEKKLKVLGEIQLHQPIPLGWMDFTFTLEQYYPAATPTISYSPLDPNAMVTPDVHEAIEVELDREKYWLELGGSVQHASGDSLYYVQYTKRQIDLGFDVFLKEFRIGYYPGTQKAKSYESLVRVGDEEHLIHMNHPLHLDGYTFYQASYETDERGKPTFSVLSVNRDPGRWVKYLGSLMIVFGVISMFYFKPKYSGKNKWLATKNVTVEKP